MAKRDDTKVEKFHQSLKVKLTPSEVADRADRAAQILADRDAKEDEMKSTAKHQKSIIEGLDNELRRISDEVRTRTTFAEVECERRWDYGRGIVTEVRADTGEIVADRKMTTPEMQRQLPGVEA